MTEIANAAEVAKAVATALQHDGFIGAELAKNSKTIHVNEVINDDPGKAPWCGVYLMRETGEPSSMPSGYKADIRVAVVLQASSTKMGVTTDRLGRLVRRAITVILSRPGILENHVEHFKSWDTDYTYSQRDKSSLYFQMCAIDFIMTVNYQFNG